jgi:hypothetical protein
LAAVASQSRSEEEAFERLVRRASETRERALHYETMSGLSTDEDHAHARLESMRHALCVVGGGFAAAALIHAVTTLAEELHLTSDQRVALADAAGALDPEVWATLTGAS